MSDVLIKGMEMPKNCMECPCSTWKLDVRHFECLLNDGEGAFESRRTDCPLVEVKPHGRLIDADKLKRDNPSHMDADVPYVTEVTVEEIIDDAPTVLEAGE